MSVALITGGSAGLGRELVLALAEQHWTVITDARAASRLEGVWREGVVVVPGDVAEAHHQAELEDRVQEAGRLDLLVHNASALGPMRTLAEVGTAPLRDVWRTNVEAPLELTGRLLPYLGATHGILVGISSDAGVEHYPTWGAYGASKAALDHLVLTFAAENPEITGYAVDPGDMRTQMHQDAFPGEDISDRPLPATVVPHLLALVARRPASGRYRAADIAVEVPA